MGIKGGKGIVASEETAMGAGANSSVGSGAAREELVSCASGALGCIDSAVLTASEMAMSWAAKTEEDRAGVDRLFQ